MNNVVTLFEAAHTDGYKSYGMNEFFLKEQLAEDLGKEKHGGHGACPIKHQALETDAGFFLLSREKPVQLFGSTERMEEVKQRALDKLSELEKQALGY